MRSLAILAASVALSFPSVAEARTKPYDCSIVRQTTEYVRECTYQGDRSRDGQKQTRDKPAKDKPSPPSKEPPSKPTPPDKEPPSKPEGPGKEPPEKPTPCGCPGWDGGGKDKGGKGKA
jgi:hypothetical protein